MENYKKCNVLILASGRSKRMGTAKMNLMFNQKTTFLQKIILQYKQFHILNIFVIINQEESKSTFVENFLLNNTKFIINEYVAYGRFYSIKKGLSQIKNKLPTFIHNVDNPFADLELLKLLFQNLKGFDYAAPNYKGKGGHPILLSENLIKNIKSTDNFNITLQDFLNPYKKAIVNWGKDNILVNINNQDDYKNFLGTVQ